MDCGGAPWDNSSLDPPLNLANTSYWIKRGKVPVLLLDLLPPLRADVGLGGLGVEGGQQLAQAGGRL